PGRRIDKDVDIGLRLCLVARMRSEQVKRSHAERPQGGVGPLQPGYDIIAAHSSNLMRRVRIFQPIRRVGEAYCSITSRPLAYSKRFSLDRKDRPSRFSDSASSGSTMASTSRTIRPPTSIIGMRARAAFSEPLAVATVAL